jgi:hypothetical protein
MKKNIKTKLMLAFYGYSIFEKSFAEDIDDSFYMPPQYDKTPVLYNVKDTSHKTLIETLKKHFEEEDNGKDYNLIIFQITKNHIIYDIEEDYDSELVLCENYAFLSQ